MCLYTEINRERERERVSQCPYVGHVWRTALSWVCQVENGWWAHTHTHTIIHHHTHSVLTMWWKILHLFSPLFPCIAFGCVCVCMWLFMSALPLALTLTWYVKSSVPLSIAWLWAGQWLFLSPHILFTQRLCPLSNIWRGPGMPCVCLAMVRVSLGETPVTLF